MGLTASRPRDRVGDVRRQYRTQYAYVYAPVDAVQILEPVKKKKTTKKARAKAGKKASRYAWMRYDLVLLSRFPRGTSSRYKHLRARRASLGPLLPARERHLIIRDILTTKKPWAEV